MKLLIMSSLLMSFSLMANAAGDIVQDGKCGPYKPSLRVRGASAVSISSAHRDADLAAQGVCKHLCKDTPSSLNSCGIYDSEVKNGIYYVNADYLCGCAF